MPTSTLFQWHLENLGPLTTTFTAAPSCATVASNVVIAAASLTDGFMFHADCSAWKYGDCYPSGPSIDAAILTIDTSQPTAGWTMNYFSPGLLCPSGWTTAGLATKSQGGDITSSGPAFTLPTTETISSHMGIYDNPGPNVLLGAMKEEETAVLCCPSSMAGNLLGRCQSVLPSYTLTSACDRYFPSEDTGIYTTELSIFGTTVTADLFTLTNTLPVSSTSRTTFAASDSSEYVGVTVMPMVTLIHRAEDVESASTASESDSPSETGTTTESGTATSSPNAGVPARVSTGAPGLGLSFLVIVIAMMAGSSLLFVL